MIPGICWWRRLIVVVAIRVLAVRVLPTIPIRVLIEAYGLGHELVLLSLELVLILVRQQELERTRKSINSPPNRSSPYDSSEWWLDTYLMIPLGRQPPLRPPSHMNGSDYQI